MLMVADMNALNPKGGVGAKVKAKLLIGKVIQRRNDTNCNIGRSGRERLAYIIAN
jgi:hypothetical protein